MRKRVRFLSVSVLFLALFGTGVAGCGVIITASLPRVVWTVEAPPVTAIAGTEIYYWEEQNLFRHRGTWYWYHSNKWYYSQKSRGPFRVCTRVPRAFVSSIPRSHPAWNRAVVHHPQYSTILAGTRAPTVSVGAGIPAITWKVAAPPVARIAGTEIYYWEAQNLFRYRSRWYWYRGGKWYEARSPRGPFRSCRNVPAVFVRRIPRTHPAWRRASVHHPRYRNIVREPRVRPPRVTSIGIAA